MEEFKTLINFIPTLNGKTVLQLGVSQDLTRVLVDENLNRIIIADSDQNLLDQVHQSFANNTNLEILNSNLSEIDLASRRFDFVFLSSLLFKLSDEECLNLINIALKHLNVGGYLFFRESCVGADSTRTPITFIDLVQSKELQEDEQKFGFDLVFAKPNRSFSSNVENSSKVSFLFTKIKLKNYHGFKTLKEFMDHKQYSRNGVLRYEKIFGAGFVSTGGIDTTTVFLKELDLKPNQRVLDVGCGIGGGDFLMAEQYGVEVLGIDLSSNMVGIAWERAQEHKNTSTQFEIGDITKQKFPDNYFDLIYSRDTILHIKDKESLFAQFKKWLKPGGKVFITDYCCGPKPWSDEFAAYVDQRGYDLRTVPEYGQIFTNLGYSTVKALDRTDLFVESLNNELKKMDEIKQDFIQEFSEEDFNYLIDGWKAKLVRCAAGYQKWGYFYCEN